ncbi:MAG TPA: serine/threonine-protein kinase [Gemmatimonadaceae bacterium]|nr:serine/threonine-protein kinase [Gemmatimonadaceae bacterium]
MEGDDRFLDYGGQFRLVQKIATGGMATVYEAQHLGPDGFAKRVAMKVIHPRYAREKHWLQLFINEAKLSADLVHGNIVQIYQLGEVDGQYYITMEYIRGPTLRSMIDRHRELDWPMPTSIAAYIASRVCRALDYAHNFTTPPPDSRRLDIVHRDVSPRNVMASWDGHIKLADFGIAKANTSFDPAASRTMALGKKHYMSPEQILGLEVDARSDVFAVGLVLFEMLSLDQVFAEDMTELAIDEVTTRPIPLLRSRVPGAPPAIEQIIAAALDRDPARRPSAATMGAVLDRWCEEQPVVASPDRLQEHLVALFPSASPWSGPHQPPGEHEVTRFSAFRRGLRTAPAPRRTLLHRLLRR